MAVYAFDVYGTLFDVRNVQVVAGDYCADGEAFARTWRAKQLEYTQLLSLMGHYQDFWVVTQLALDYTAQSLKVALDDVRRQRLLDSWLDLPPFPDALLALERLDATRCAVLSNGSPQMLETLLVNSGLRSRFAHICSVDPARIYKPAPAAYTVATAHLGVPKEEVIFFSANSWDAIGAKAFGFTVCWVNRLASPLDPLGVQPDYTGASLTDLLSKLNL